MQSIAWLWIVRMIYQSLFIFYIYGFLSSVPLEQVLLGESPGCELENSFPTKSGLQTVLEVLQIQMNFWPSLGPIFMNLQSQWRMRLLVKKSEDCFLFVLNKPSNLISFWNYFILIYSFLLGGMVGILVGRGKFAILSIPCITKLLCTPLEASKYLITIIIITFVGKQTKKRRRVVAPMWWRWGRKCFLFHFLNGHLRVKSKWWYWADEFWSIGMLSNYQHVVYIPSLFQTI